MKVISYFEPHYEHNRNTNYRLSISLTTFTKLEADELSCEKKIIEH